MEKRKKRKNILTLFGNSFIHYWKNLHVALPMLLFFLLLLILFFVFAIITISLLAPLLNAVSDIGKDVLQSPQQPQLSFLFSNPSNLYNKLITLLVVGALFALIGIIAYAVFFSSMLVFIKEIVTAKPAKATIKRNYFKLCFKNRKYWLKLIGVWALQVLLGIIYFAILFGIIFAVKNPIAIFIITLVGLIAAYFLYVFIITMPNVVVFYDTGIFKSFNISIKNAAHNYWPLLGLVLLIDVATTIVSIVFGLIPFVGSFIVLLISFVIFIPFKSIALMHFIAERFEA